MERMKKKEKGEHRCLGEVGRGVRESKREGRGEKRREKVKRREEKREELRNGTKKRYDDDQRRGG